MLKDRIPRILKYFDSQECADKPLTDKCSKYFWLTEPTTYYNFNTVKGINYNHDEQEINVSDTDTDTDDEDTLMTTTEFQKSSHWYNFNGTDFQQQMCPICQENFEENARISVLNCHHQYHSNCIRKWLTTRNSTCPTCRERSRGIQLKNIPTILMNNTS
ncbi:hypothetical protein HMI54_005377 [Coelomomyces lativittatus]|nr:hypothetical protein HMI56_001907 [Coelomomyces lativittatus]KAJ1517481.1 hypothetical protein HMI54_005377 [Coelomomyces lativittatus]